jgi:hypothetical protein
VYGPLQKKGVPLGFFPKPGSWRNILSGQEDTRIHRESLPASVPPVSGQTSAARQHRLVESRGCKGEPFGMRRVNVGSVPMSASFYSL